MGWAQDTIWNNAFSYAYPISFLGAIFYGVLAVAQTDVSNVITNKNWLVAFNVFIGLCGLISISVWFNADASFVNTLTQYVDLDVNKVKANVKKA
jgi:uncharacterized membrane protein YuzA (DUF378 family)